MTDGAKLNLPAQMTNEMYQATMKRALVGAWLCLNSSLDSVQENRFLAAQECAKAGNEVLDLADRLRIITEGFQR